MRKYTFRGVEYTITDKEYNAYAKDLKELGDEITEEDILEGICRSQAIIKTTRLQPQRRGNLPNAKRRKMWTKIS